MNWKNPAEELPEDGALVWILDQHRSKNGVLSCEIIGSIVRHIKSAYVDSVVAENSENPTSGWRTWVLKDHKGQAKSDDHAVAWCPLEEIPLPPFIEHRRKST